MNPVLILGLFFALPHFSNCRFDFDELNYNFYDVSILDAPALVPNFDNLGANGDNLGADMGQITELPASFENFTDRFLIGNKQGRIYYCGLPAMINNRELNALEIQHRIDVLNNLTDIKIDEILNSYLKKCLKKTIGWWTYEFCFNDIVYQYHLEDGKITDEKLVLGRLDPSFVWNKSEQNTSYVYKKQAIYYSRNYTYGSLCDLSSKLRQTEVKFYCDQDLFGADLRRVDEPETCRYVLHVYVGGLCKFEPFVPANKKIEAQGLECVPTLSPSEMERYQQYKARNETASAKKELESFPKLNMKQGLPVWDFSHMDMANQDEDNSGIAGFFAEEIVNRLLDKAKITTLIAPSENSQSSSDAESRDQTSDDSAPSEGGANDEGSNVNEIQNEGNQMDTEESASAKQSISAGPDDSADPDKENAIEKYKFEDDENSEDEKNDLENSKEKSSAKNEATLRALASTLRRLINEMEKTERVIETANEKLGEAEQKLNGANQRLERILKTSDKKSIMKKLTNQKSAQFLRKNDQKTSQKTNPFIEWRKKSIESSEEAELTETDQSENFEELENDIIEQTKKLENQLTLKLENQLSAKLKQSQAPENTKKIRIEIATAYYDEETNEMKVLSTGSDSKHVTNLLSYLLGNGEQQKEEKRHAKLEQNYLFDFEGDSIFEQIEGQNEEKNEENDVTTGNNDVTTGNNVVTAENNDENNDVTA